MRLLFKCQRCRLEKRTWSSSRVFGGHYLVNQKLVLFLCVCECVCVSVCVFGVRVRDYTDLFFNVY